MATNVHQAVEAGDVALGVARRRVLVVGEPGEDGAESGKDGEPEHPGGRDRQAFDSEDDAEEVEQQGGGGGAHNHVDEDGVERVTEPGAVQQVLEQLAGRAEHAVRGVDRVRDPVREAAEGPRPTFDH